MQFRIAYSIADACTATSCGRTTIYKAIKCGKLRAVKVGRRTVITASDLIAWLNSGVVTSSPAALIEHDETLASARQAGGGK
jgi:excisionase family DNA binding protein